jgi:hypothetical protein
LVDLFAIISEFPDLFLLFLSESKGLTLWVIDETLSNKHFFVWKNQNLFLTGWEEFHNFLRWNNCRFVRLIEIGGD